MRLGPHHSWLRFPWALLAGVWAPAVLAVPGVGALLGVVDADGVDVPMVHTSTATNTQAKTTQTERHNTLTG